MNGTQLVRVSDLAVRFTTEDRVVNSVNGIDCSLDRGEVLTILGESGSGKSVTLRALMRLLPERRARIAGRIEVAGRDVLTLSPNELASFRGSTVAMVFQDPTMAFDPVFTIGHQ